MSERYCRWITVLSLLVLPLLPLLAFGQAATTGVLTGRVYLPTGRPAAQAGVLLAGQRLTTVTDEAGQWKLVAPAGAYRLLIRLPEYAATETNVRINAGQTTAVAPITLALNEQGLSEVKITGQQTANERPVAVGKMAVRPLDLPQSVQTVERQVLEQQQTLRLSDVLANVTGVYVMGTTGGAQEELAGRGFAFTSNNTFKNGVRYNNAIMPEVSSLERFEVLKGSNAILYGNVAAGGVVNLVTKKPRFESGGSVGVRVGSYDFYKPMIDVYGAVNGSERVAYRVNTTYESARSFRDHVSGERFYVNPSVLVKVGPKTDLLVEADYLRDARTPDFGLGTINYTIAEVPRSRYLNTAWARTATTQRSATATLTHQLGTRWQLNAKAGYQGYQNDLLSASRPIGIRPNGDWVRSAQQTGTDESYYLAETNLTGQFQTGGLGHQLLIGGDADKYHTQTVAHATIARYDSINLYAPAKYAARTDVPAFTRSTRTTAPVGRVGAYVQDLISVGERVKVLVGVRYSYFEATSRVLTYARNTTTDVTRYDAAFTPRFGVVYQPRRTTALFASYANSFTLNTGLDATGARLPPSYLNQVEAGVKNDLFDGRLTANVTAYHIVNSNLAQTLLATDPRYNPDLPTAQELAGEVTSRGIELDLQTRPVRGWSLLGGYSYNHTQYTRSNTFIVGSLLRYNPAHTASLSASYTVPEGRLRGLSAGLVTYYVGERQAGRSTRLTVKNDAFRLIPLAAYTQLDASVGYTLDRLTLRVKLSNVLNQLSYNVHDDNSVNPIAPRQFATTLTYQLF